jgi:DNA-binding SARP family transcriptional activator
LQVVDQTRVQVCGRLAVCWRGRRVEDDLPARQGRLLFVHLVVNCHRAVARDELVEALWGAAAPPAAAGTLRALLSRLRRVLGPDAVTGGEEPRLALDAGAFVDLEAARAGLHRAEAAVARGDGVAAWVPARIALHTAARGFLPGHDAPWIIAVRRELDDMHVRALECVAEAGLLMGGGETRSAERAGRRLVELAPYRESGYRLLMEALAARGNGAEAVLVYERARTVLRDELGVAPGAVLQALHARLIAG